MKILIAGGAGYIGSALIPKLIDRGYDLTVLDLLWFGNNLPKDIKLIEKDIMEIDSKLLEGYDQVIFLAGLSNDPMAEFSPAKNFIDNAAAPSYLAYLSKIAGVNRFIYASSCSVYGYTINELYDEKSPAISNYPYGISKLQGEQAAMQLQDDSFSVISLRQGTVSGFSPRMRLDLVINTMFKCAMQDQKIVVNNPSIWRPILGLDDAVSAYIRSIESSDKISGIFNVASGNYTIGEIADVVIKFFSDNGYDDIELELKNITDFRNYKVSTEKAEKVLGFNPSQTIRKILNTLLDNYRQFKDLDNSIYYNIEIFKKIL